MITLNSIFNFLPIVLAVIAAIMCTRRFHEDRRKHDRATMAMAVVSCMLLVLAQTSWWTTYIIEGNLMGTWFANTVWTIFNTLVMSTFILISYRPKK